MKNSYWLVRSNWGGYDEAQRFIANDEWENGYKDKYLDIVKRVKEGDILLLAKASEVIYFGKCISNEDDGRHLYVDKWVKFKKSIYFPAVGAYVKTIAKVKDDSLLEELFYQIKAIKEQEFINISSIKLNNFTLFKNSSFNFINGINIFLGENGTGKTQVMKLMYALLKSNNLLVDKTSNKHLVIPRAIIDVLKPENLHNLISINKNNSEILIDFDKYKVNIELEKENHIKFNTPSDFYEKSAIFIPAKEILSFYEGFISIFEKTSFDITYYDLANMLGILVSDDLSLEKKEIKILTKLEDSLGGKIVIDSGKFYLKKDNYKIEISLIAEGLRKIGTIYRLIANESLNKNTILFWDEPESNLNPRLIKDIAKILIDLSSYEVQIFIATHSLFLVKEIEILRKETDKIKYFGFSFDEKLNLQVEQDEKLENIENLAFLDEEVSQSDRYFEKNA